MISLEKQQVLITGAAGALGQAVCRQAKALGARVIGMDRVAMDDLKDIDQAIQVDLTQRSDTQNAFGQLAYLDTIIHVAGGFTMGTGVEAADDTDWDHMQTMNVVTLRHTLKSGIAIMRKTSAVCAGIPGSRSILTVGALGALKGQANMSAYCAAKATVMRITESLAEELKAEGIRCNSVLPSIIDTPANRTAMPDADFSQWATTDELAQTLCFLASPAASGITGALIPVAGRV